MKHPNSLLRLGAIATAAALVLSACGSTDDVPAATGDDTAVCDLKLAFLGPLTGPAANLGLNMTGGIKVALDEYNAENADCPVTVEEFDSQGDPEKATPLASEIVQDSKVIGLVGPAFSGETLAEIVCKVMLDQPRPLVPAAPEPQVDRPDAEIEAVEDGVAGEHERQQHEPGAVEAHRGPSSTMRAKRNR